MHARASARPMEASSPPSPSCSTGQPASGLVKVPIFPVTSSFYLHPGINSTIQTAWWLRPTSNVISPFSSLFLPTPPYHHLPLLL
eukprot:scaffold67192_cov32-Tisochrysis_lutea.AAC.2